MFSVEILTTLAGAFITAVSTLSVALARIKALEKKVEDTVKEIEQLKALRTDDKNILVRLETKMDMLLSGKACVPQRGYKK